MFLSLCNRLCLMTRACTVCVCKYIYRINLLNSILTSIHTPLCTSLGLTKRCVSVCIFLIRVTVSAWSGPVHTGTQHKHFYILHFGLPELFLVHRHLSQAARMLLCLLHQRRPSLEKIECRYTRQHVNNMWMRSTGHSTDKWMLVTLEQNIKIKKDGCNTF